MVSSRNLIRMSGISVEQSICACAVVLLCWVFCCVFVVVPCMSSPKSKGKEAWPTPNGWEVINVPIAIHSDDILAEMRFRVFNWCICCSCPF